MGKKKENINRPLRKDDEVVVSSKEYDQTFADLKNQIRASQLKSAWAANKELIHLYWVIGKIIVEKQECSGWGTRLIEKLAKDIQNEFPGIEGFSRTNIFRMRAFYTAYRNNPPDGGQFQNNPPEILMNISWRHNSVLVEKLKNPEERIWYAQKTIEHGWSRSILETMIKNFIHRRQGKAITNFKATLPATQSDLAQNTLKDPYLIDFISLSDDIREKDIENQLTEHMQKFLVELGQGFAFVGRQYPIKVGEKRSIH